MIPKECKRLAEVDFPIAEVSQYAVRENPARRGHPSTLHLWWARRPLASSRAVLMALLLPDPCDPHCPQVFKEEARRILLGLSGRPQGWMTAIKSDEGLRRLCLEFIAEFANWDNAVERRYLEASHALVKAAHDDVPPLVVDPFAGGGSIPLEALRLGCEVFSSDLNPVACLILKVMLQDVQRYGPELAEDLRRVGEGLMRQAKQALVELYPLDPDGATPIAYLWARTVHCEAPNCGAEIPLMRSFWLCKKKNRKRALRPRIERPPDQPPYVEFEIFDPNSGEHVHRGTVTGARATCLCCPAVLPPERVRAQLTAERGGADVAFDTLGHRIGGARMTAVVTLQPGKRGRHYRLPTDGDYAVVRRAQERVRRVLGDWEHDGRQGICPVPNEPTPSGGGSGASRAFSVQRYGMVQWSDLFTARQLSALVELSRLVCERLSSEQHLVQTVMALSIDKLAMMNSSGCRWKASGESLVDTFGRRALPIVWDFAESSPVSGSSGDFYALVDRIAEAANNIPRRGAVGVQLADATNHPLPDESASVWFTDPPYYDAIPYADLTDFFLIWLKRTLPNLMSLRDPFDPDNPLSPKTQEVVQDETKLVNGHPKDRGWFENTMGKAFAEGRRVLTDDGIGSVVFAHKTTEGWEALLAGMIQGGWTITASWPIATERPSRLRSRDSAALATSVHLICRPRSPDAPVGDWADVLHELPRRVADWMERLQREGIRGADLVFACVGPALEIFSQYCAVETADGHKVRLADYLEKVWEVVGRAALEQVLGTVETPTNDGLAGALEEDARLTALFLWTLQSTFAPAANPDSEGEVETAVTKVSGFSLPFDVVRRFAQPMGIDLDTWTGGIIGQKKGIVRLLPVAERAKDLFGDDGINAAADWIERDAAASLTPSLFPEIDGARELQVRGRGGRNILGRNSEFQHTGATTLDYVHAAMLLQDSGHSNALRDLIVAEQDRGPDFLRLANALSALYPRDSQEKRLLDAMLLAVPQ